MKYVIHACPKRMWYVENYLVPSLEAQGIKTEDIDIRCDKYKRGNLEQCMQIFSVMFGDGGAWHLQDDVIICRDFKKRTEEFKDYVICGFVHSDDENIKNTGFVLPQNMWWSFPCIYIPNHMALECSKWFFATARYDKTKYASWLASGQYDDAFFREFLKIYFPENKVLNLKPCLVDHIDFLIGGTTVKKVSRAEIIRSEWFEDLDLVDELKEKIENSEYGELLNE